MYDGRSAYRVCCKSMVHGNESLCVVLPYCRLVRVYGFCCRRLVRWCSFEVHYLRFHVHDLAAVMHIRLGHLVLVARVVDDVAGVGFSTFAAPAAVGCSLWLLYICFFFILSECKSQ